MILCGNPDAADVREPCVCCSFSKSSLFKDKGFALRLARVCHS